MQKFEYYSPTKLVFGLVCISGKLFVFSWTGFRSSKLYHFNFIKLVHSY